MIARRFAALRALAADGRGVTALEFGFVAPVLCLGLVGALDMGHTLYLKAAMQGLMQKVGRDAALETATTDVLAAQDTVMRNQIMALTGPDATIDLTRTSYRTFGDASRAMPEPWTDSNGDHRCNAGEPYVDANNNNTWDADGGRNGQGGAKDKTLYTASVTYRRLFPLYNFINVSPDITLVARTVLQNQPFSDQTAVGTTVGHCA